MLKSTIADIFTPHFILYRILCYISIVYDEFYYANNHKIYRIIYRYILQCFGEYLYMNEINYNEFYAQIARRIYELRRENGLSSRKLSAEMNFSESYLNKVENLKATVSVPALITICEYFNISLAEFFSFQTENPVELHELTEIYSKLNKENAALLLTIAEKLAESQNSVKPK